MARIVLTNSPKIGAAIQQSFVAAGFTDYHQVTDNSIFVSVHQKKIKKIKNILKFDNGDFCAITGTCLYKEEFQELALHLLYNDFQGNAEAIRKNCLGNYVIAIKKAQNISIFVDKYSVMDLFYYQEGDTWIISNEISALAKEIPNLEVDNFTFMARALLMAQLGDKTMFKNIYRLCGQKLISLTLPKNILSIHEIPYTKFTKDFTNTTIEEAAQEYGELIRQRMKPIIKHFGHNIRIQQTGGLDNRTIFAGLMGLGCKPKTMYGVGDSVITSTRDTDLQICHQYQKRYNLDFYPMNWKGDDIKNISHYEEMFNQYGFFYTLYSGNMNIFNEYNGKIPDYPDFIECGYFLEALRLRENIKDKCTLEEFIEQNIFTIYGGCSKKSRNNDHYSQFFNQFCLDYKKELGKLNFPQDMPLTKQNFDEIRWIHCRYADSITVRLVNDFTSSMAIFSDPILHEYPFTVPYKMRDNAKFQLHVIGYLFKDVLNIPFFTHEQAKNFNKKTYELSNKIDYVLKIKIFIKKYTPECLYLFIKKIYYKYINKQGYHDDITCYNPLYEAYHKFYSTINIDKEIGINMATWNNIKIKAFSHFVQVVYGLKLTLQENKKKHHK